MKLSLEQTGQWMETYKICIIVPTYNNVATLPDVIHQLLVISKNIIVVNDGSTDATGSFLSTLDNQISIIDYTPNKGKGNALRAGFKFAHKAGYDYAITIDSDGQHYVDDIPYFVEKVKDYPNALILGARGFNHENMPGKNSFGNKFSNFWFWIETGLKMPDTQTGYRLYPIYRYDKTVFFTKKYEFELEALVRSAWRGIDIVSIPIKVHYAPPEERISHFRPFRDFSRISVLNTFLVFIAFLWIKPRDFFKKIFSQSVRETLRQAFLDPKESVQKKAVSVGFGIFMGIVPIWGFQMIAALAISFWAKLNKPLVILASNISIPPLIPVIIYLSLLTGGLVMGDDAVSLNFDNSLTLAEIKKSSVQYIFGSVLLAIFAGAFFGIFTYLVLRIRKK